MRGHTHATRAATRHSKSRSGLATSARGWGPAAAPEEAGVAGGGHDLARISVSAPAGAPIQRVQWPWMLPGASDEDRYHRPPPPAPAPAPINVAPAPAPAPAPVPVHVAPAPVPQPLAVNASSASASSSSSDVSLAPPPSSSVVVPSQSPAHEPLAPNPLASSVPAIRLDDIEAANNDNPSAAPRAPSPRNRGRSAELLANLLSAAPAASSSSSRPVSSAVPAVPPSSESSGLLASSARAPRASYGGVDRMLRSPVAVGEDPLGRVDASHNIQAAPAAAAHIPSRPFSGADVREFVTANTPGPITGVSGLTSTAVSLRAGPGNTPTGALGSVGLGTNVATGAADAVGLLSDAHTAISMGPSRFVSGLGRTLTRTPGRNAQEAEDRSASKRVVANTAQNAWDATNQASSILTATGQHVPQALGAVASGAGVGVNALVAARSAYRGIRAHQHQGAMDEEIRRGNLSPEMRAAAEHHSKQMKWRKIRSGLGFAGAAAGVAGGALLLAGMATPVGWGLAAAGGLVAAGLGAWKLGRWAYKKYKGTLGVERERHAQTLHNAINDRNAPARDRQQATRLLAARGITPAEVTGPEGRDLLKRKAEAW